MADAPPASSFSAATLSTASIAASELPPIALNYAHSFRNRFNVEGIELWFLVMRGMRIMTDNVYPFRPRIDVNNQLAARRAIRSILQTQRVAISSRRFHEGEVTVRVVVDGKYYDVDALRLEQLRSGLSPANLDLVSVRDATDFRG